MADFTVAELLGGAELTCQQLIDAGRALGHEIVEITSRKPHGLRRNDYDLMIVNNVKHFRLIEIMAALKARFVYFCHDPLVLPIQATLFSRARRVIFCSPLQRRFYAERFSLADDRVVVMPPPIEASRFRPLEKEDYAVAVGEIGPHKGLEHVIRFAEEHPELPVRLYGRKASSSTIPSRPNLEYMGVAAYADVPRIVGHAKVFVHLPNCLECYGRAVMEAYLCGCELIVNGNIGALSFEWPWDDPNAVRENLARAPRDFWSLVTQLSSERDS